MQRIKVTDVYEAAPGVYAVVASNETTTVRIAVRLDMLNPEQKAAMEEIISGSGLDTTVRVLCPWDDAQNE